MCRWHSLCSSIDCLYLSPSPRAFLQMSGVHMNSVLSRFSLFSHRLLMLVRPILRLLGQVRLLHILLGQVKMKMKLPHLKQMSPMLLRGVMSKHCILTSINWRRTSRSFRITWLPKKLQLSVPLPAMASCSLKCKELPSSFYVRTRHISLSSFVL